LHYFVNGFGGVLVLRWNLNFFAKSTFIHLSPFKHRMSDPPHYDSKQGYPSPANGYTNNNQNNQYPPQNESGPAYPQQPPIAAYPASGQGYPDAQNGYRMNIL
jgi:hypothetical protein